ncbi:tyrosine-protein phosphatase [Paenibacillus validus]|uniref:Tyrosine-protein phosphatase n=1 Tax=Paenibacillus validus TaxID=44253 RepID=A0A7X3CS03_9BACL|nr:CpsB/CapC family capsule biosynthesis tyrosine phosphatase [Paenibacillus validus]MUG70792.1 tyrosine protein phosphatase [Paenibacillus validus]
MIDIHTHILPGIDDGAADERQALLMARAAEKEGIHTLIATPHHYNGKYTNPGGQVRHDVAKLNTLLEENAISVKVLAGQEVRIHRELLDELQSGHAITLHDTAYLLLELPTADVPAYTEEMIHELRLMNRIPIIAHPERNAVLAASPDKLARLIDLGALAQLTSHSVNGAFGRKLQKLCFAWCEQGLAHFISSDAHNVDSRAFALRQAYSLVAEQCGEAKVDYFTENARRIIHNEEVPVLAPQAHKKKWWSFWS